MVASIAYRITAVVTFPADSAIVPEGELGGVKEVAVAINSIKLGLEIEGHADPSERAPDLQMARAKNVLDLLVKYGVEARRLIPVDKGIGPAPEGVDRNSRVTFNVRHDMYFGCE
jgi:flagellar motor protein MotB